LTRFKIRRRRRGGSRGRWWGWSIWDLYRCSGRYKCWGRSLWDL